MATQAESGGIPIPPTKEQWDELSRDVKAQLLDEMGEESWYLIIVSSIRPYCVNGWSRLYVWLDCSDSALERRDGIARQNLDGRSIVMGTALVMTRTALLAIVTALY
jgi:hypothetical protein